jgi:hypothetical protein
MVVSDSTGRERDTSGADFLQWLLDGWCANAAASASLNGHNSTWISADVGEKDAVGLDRF